MFNLSSGPGQKRFIIYSIFGWILPIGMNVIVVILGRMDHVDDFFLSKSGSQTGNVFRTTITFIEHEVIKSCFYKFQS